MLAEHRRVLLTLGVGVMIISAARSTRQSIVPLWAESHGIDAATTSVIFGISAAVDMLLFYPGGAIMDRFGRVFVAVPAMIVLGAWLRAVAADPHGDHDRSGGGAHGARQRHLGRHRDDPRCRRLARANRTQFLGGWRLCSDLGNAAGPLVISAVSAVAPLAAAAVTMGVLTWVGSGWLIKWVPRYAVHVRSPRSRDETIGNRRVMRRERAAGLGRLRDDRPRPDHDALIEVAALVTDAELNMLGDGVDLVIKPSPAALDQMGDFVRAMHDGSGLLAALDEGLSMREAEERVLDYVRQFVPEPRKAPLAGNTIGTDRAFLARDMADLRAARALPQRRRVQHQGTRPPLVSAGLLPGAGQVGQPPGAGRRPGVDRGAALLPGGRLRPASPARTAPTAKRDRRPAPGRADPRRTWTPRSLTARASERPQIELPSRDRYTSRCADGAGSCRRRRRVVGVAQLVEHLVVVQAVAGSSPVTHPKVLTGPGTCNSIPLA